MPDFKDDLTSQGERLNALAPVVDAMFDGMAGGYRRANTGDTKIAMRQGRQQLARDILARRRKEISRVPDDLPERLHGAYRRLVKILGPATLPLVTPGTLAHYVRAQDALEALGHMMDLTDSIVARTVMLPEYLKQARQLAALAKAINISTHSNVMQLAVIAELRVEGRASRPLGPAGPDDWRQHALTLDAEDEAPA